MGHTGWVSDAMPSVCWPAMTKPHSGFRIVAMLIFSRENIYIIHMFFTNTRTETKSTCDTVQLSVLLPHAYLCIYSGEALARGDRKYTSLYKHIQSYNCTRWARGLISHMWDSLTFLLGLTTLVPLSIDPNPSSTHPLYWIRLLLEQKEGLSDLILYNLDTSEFWSVSLGAVATPQW